MTICSPFSTLEVGESGLLRHVQIRAVRQTPGQRSLVLPSWSLSKNVKSRGSRYQGKSHLLSIALILTKQDVDAKRMMNTTGGEEKFHATTKHDVARATLVGYCGVWHTVGVARFNAAIRYHIVYT